MKKYLVCLLIAATSALAQDYSPRVSPSTIGAQPRDTELDGWALKAPYLGTLTILNGKTINFSNSLSFAGTDNATLNIGGGGTLGSSAFVNIGSWYKLTGLLTSGGTFQDSLTYFVGGGNIGASAANHTTWSNSRLYIPKSGTIKTLIVSIGFSTVGTTENVSHYIRLNDTTDTTLSTTETYDEIKTMAYTGLSVAVAAGDYIALKINTPAWATNPTGVNITADFYIE